jgi:archaellum biogenesis protein FlaJ (TadC family)
MQTINKLHYFYIVNKIINYLLLQEGDSMLNLNSEKTMDKILVIMFWTLIVFTITMILLYIFTGGTPDTLIISFFGAFTGECGFMGWIKTVKENNKKRAQQLEDEKRQRDLMKEMNNN